MHFFTDAWYVGKLSHIEVIQSATSGSYVTSYYLAL